MKRLISNLRRRDLPHYSSDLEDVLAVKKIILEADASGKMS